LRWTVGDVTITKTIEFEATGKTTWILPDPTAENLATIPWGSGS
jgi:hypothetical protein